MSVESLTEELRPIKVLTQVVTRHLGSRDDAECLTQYNNTTQTWETINYGEFDRLITRWQRAFMKSGLEHGSRVAMLLPNGVNALCFDQAALRCAYVPVPLHAVDTPGSSAFILNDSQARILVTAKYLKWKKIRDTETLPNLKTVIITDDEVPATDNDNGQIQVITLNDWLDQAEGFDFIAPELDEDDLAALVYTSGTTGRPKGVMLTHKNIVTCFKGVVKLLTPGHDERWFSFLPMSHTFERTTTYYFALACGNAIFFNRNILHIADDMKRAKATIMMSVPRIYETIYGRIQDGLSKKGPVVQYLFNWAVEVGWRRFCKKNQLPVEHTWREFLDPLVANFLDKKVAVNVRGIFGNPNAHAYISGGAAINKQVLRCFLGLGLPLYQGYGMTETSPVVCVNGEYGINNPFSVGEAFDCCEIRLGENNELQIRGDTVMKGYWNREDATREVFTQDGWLRTGDQVEILPTGHIVIKGRIKEIIVTSTGEKIPPADLEMAMETDPLLLQTMTVGEGMPFISAVVVLHKEHWKELAESLQLDPNDPNSLQNKRAIQYVLKRVKSATKDFPQYGVPRSVILTLEPWSIDNGMLTPTLKLKRRVIKAKYQDQIAALYAERG